MEELIEDLKDYIARTTPEQRQKDWKELERYANPGESLEPNPVMVGRFQPFTNTDLGNLIELSNEYHKPVCVVCVRSHQFYQNTPFKWSTVKKMLELIKESYPGTIGDIFVSDEWDISELLYKKLIVPSDIIRSDHDSIKSSVIRLAIALDARSEFERCTPECIHTMYEELREEIYQYTEKGK